MTIKIYYTLKIGFLINENDYDENAIIQGFLNIGYKSNNYTIKLQEFEVNPNKDYTKRYISKFLKKQIKELENCRLKIIEKPESKFSIFKYVLLG